MLNISLLLLVRNFLKQLFVFVCFLDQLHQSLQESYLVQNQSLNLIQSFILWIRHVVLKVVQVEVMTIILEEVPHFNGETNICFITHHLTDLAMNLNIPR
jgi:hypothetical protein